MNNEQPKLKPVTFISGKYNFYHGHDNFKEMMLLKAMRMTSDPKILMKMTGLKSIADISRTFDKISMRKEYHRALNKHGMSFEWIARGLKADADNADKAADRIKAFQIILKSLGMDTYEDIPSDTGGWEDMVLKASEESRSSLPSPSSDPIDIEYDVVQPKIPKDMENMREKENKQGKSIYE